MSDPYRDNLTFMSSKTATTKNVGIDEILSADTGPKLPVDGVNLKKDYAPIRVGWQSRNAHVFGDLSNDAVDSIGFGDAVPTNAPIHTGN